MVLLATCSAVGAYAHALFWMYVVQACLLMLVAPLLLGAGAPVALAAAAVGPASRERLEAWGRSPLGRFARLPGVGPLVLIVATAVLFFTPVMTLSLRSDLAGELVRAGLLGVGLLLALPVTDEQVGMSSLAYAAALGLAFVEFLLDAVPGIALRLHGTLLQEAYWSGLHRPWGPSPMEDQHLAGACLWFFAEAGDIPFFAALLVAWIRSDAREARAQDAALDAAAAARVTATEDAVPGRPVLERPWWEVDASVFGEERARGSGWGRAPGPRGRDDSET